jgi:hypothetical protein
VLPLVAALWTLFVWGGRIGLLTDAESAALRTWMRVGVSLLFVAALPVAAWMEGRRPRQAAAIDLLFGAWMAVIWIPDAVGLFGGGRSAGFVIVHLILAAVSLGLAGLLAPRAHRLLFGRRAL